MKKVSRRQRDAQRQRAEIMSAAERMFSTKGFHQTTIKGVAREAEYGVGTVYKFFSSKEKLYLAVIENKMSELLHNIKKKVSEEIDVLNKIKVFVQIWLEFFASNKDLFKLLVSEIDEQRLAVRKRLREKIFKQHAELTELVSSTFKEAIRKGLIKDYEPGLLAYAIGGVTKNVIAQKLLTGESIEPARDAETIFKIFAYGVLKNKSRENEGD